MRAFLMRELLIFYILPDSFISCYCSNGSLCSLFEMKVEVQAVKKLLKIPYSDKSFGKKLIRFYKKEKGEGKQFLGNCSIYTTKSFDKKNLEQPLTWKMKGINIKVKTITPVEAGVN